MRWTRSATGLLEKFEPDLLPFCHLNRAITRGLKREDTPPCMQNHVFGLVHRLVTPGRVCTSPAHRTCQFQHQHLPGARRGVIAAQATVRKVAHEHIDTSNYINIDSPSFRQTVQDWREQGNVDTSKTVSPTISSRAPRTNAASRHRKRLEVAWNGQLTTPISQLSPAQIAVQEFCRSESYYIDALPLSDTTLVLNPVTPSSQRKEPILYQTLLSHIHSHIPLSSLVKFHAAQPSWKRTTKTYNLLISHALMHASFSTVDTLILLLRRDGLRPTLQTEKLTIRSWILTGRWEWAWRSTKAKHSGMENVPLVLWMEFFGGTKRGALRKRGRVLGDDERAIRLRAEKLLQSTPKLNEEERAGMPPRTVYAIVRLMLTLGWKEKAQAFTRDYLKTLSERSHDDPLFRVCQQLVELHLVFPLPTQRRTRLSDFYERRRLALDFFALHDKVNPSLRTLCLLLSSLHHVKHPCMLAQATIKLFRKKWSSIPIDDRRVHRLLARLALKEHRVLMARRLIRRPKTPHCIEVVSSRSFIKRPRYEELYTRHGAENYKWKRLERKVRLASK